MFEVIEIGGTTKKSWFSRVQYLQVKLKALDNLSCEKLGRNFEGYQHYSTQTYRAGFSKDSVITVFLPVREMVTVGDKLSVESLAGQGYLDRFFRLVGTT
jgi:hypothetical protein